MTIWVDAQLSPRTAYWIAANFPVAAAPLCDLGISDASDQEIFAADRRAYAIVLTKDIDFAQLLEQQSCSPRVLWLTCGNTSDAAVQQILSWHLSTALGLLAGVEDLVEIGFPLGTKPLAARLNLDVRRRYPHSENGSQSNQP